MYNHAPTNYQCPICLAINGIENEQTYIRQTDIFFKDELIVGFIGSKFIKGNEGNPIIVPTHHFENLYDLPAESAHHLMGVARNVAIALKVARRCDGVTVLQNNEPAGDQHAFHYHMHLFPRFDGDNFHEELQQPVLSDPADRTPFAQTLREILVRK
jgi:histidine triad (HIT) family protein